MSVLNLEHKMLFIHIPKNFGDSMESTPFLKTVGHKHANIEYFAKYLLSINDLEMDDLWKFCFVRNPYERFVSGMLGHTIREAVPSEILNELTGNKIPIKPLKQKFTEFVLKHKDRLRDFEPLKPQFDFVSIGQSLAVDFVGRCENIDEGWQRVCDRVGVKFDLPHLNKGRIDKSEYESFYTPETRKIVKDFYAIDFNTFGYEK